MREQDENRARQKSGSGFGPLGRGTIVPRRVLPGWALEVDGLSALERAAGIGQFLEPRRLGEPP